MVGSFDGAKEIVGFLLGATEGNLEGGLLIVGAPLVVGIKVGEYDGKLVGFHVGLVIDVKSENDDSDLTLFLSKSKMYTNATVPKTKKNIAKKILVHALNNSLDVSRSATGSSLLFLLLIFFSLSSSLITGVGGLSSSLFLSSLICCKRGEFNASAIVSKVTAPDNLN